MATTDAEKGVARRSSSVAEKGVAFRASHARDNNGLVSSKDTYLVDLGLGDSLDDRKVCWPYWTKSPLFEINVKINEMKFCFKIYLPKFPLN